MTVCVGDDEGAVELLECLADLGDQIVEDDGGDHGNSDGEELLPLASAVDGGCFVQVCGSTASATAARRIT